MKTIKVEATVEYRVDFDCEVEVPDDFDPQNIPGSTEMKIKDQVIEAAKEYDALLEVEDVDWFIP
jgi:hypothetical protein